METNPSKYDWLISLGQFAAWMAACAGVIFDALYLREAVLDVLTWLRSRSLAAFRESGGLGPDLLTGFRYTAADMFFIFALAIISVSLMIGIEVYFRRGRPQGLLLKRIGRVAGVEAAVLLGSILVQAVL